MEMVKTMQSLLRILDAVQNSISRCILATIIQIEGSAYLREGAAMLIEEDGHCTGMISPGCLEEDLILRCKEVFLSQCPQTVTYDLRSTDDYGWGQGMGCNGVMKILLEPITDSLKHDLLNLRTALENGQSVFHKKEFSKDYTLKNYSFEIVQQHQTEDMKRYNFYHLNAGYFYTFLFTPPPTLFIFGAGEDAKPLVSLALRIGFIVKLCDWRPGLCNETQFPSVNQYIIGSPQQIAYSLNLSSDDFVVIMSHNFSKDLDFLNIIRNYDIRYLGILGSKERTERLLGGDAYQNNVFSPIGLPIGAQGPEEIAVSIMAEILQEYRQESTVSKR